MMNLVENITVELEKGPHIPEMMVTGKPQLTPLNAIFPADGYDVPTGATVGFPAMEQADSQNNKIVEDIDLHTAQKPPDTTPEPATASEREGKQEEQRPWGMTIQETGPHYLKELVEPATASEREGKEEEQGSWEMAIQETGPHYPEELALKN